MAILASCIEFKCLAVCQFIECLARGYAPFGLPSAASGACSVVQISPSKRQCKLGKLVWKQLYGVFRHASFCIHQRLLMLVFGWPPMLHTHFNISEAKSLCERVAFADVDWCTEWSQNTPLTLIIGNSSPNMLCGVIAQSPSPLYSHGEASLSKQTPQHAANDPRLARSRCMTKGYSAAPGSSPRPSTHFLPHLVRIKIPRHGGGLDYHIKHNNFNLCMI